MFEIFVNAFIVIMFTANLVILIIYDIMPSKLLVGFLLGYMIWESLRRIIEGVKR